MTASSRRPNRARNQVPDFVLFCRSESGGEGQSIVDGRHHDRLGMVGLGRIDRTRPAITGTGHLIQFRVPEPDADRLR